MSDEQYTWCILSQYPERLRPLGWFWHHSWAKRCKLLVIATRNYEYADCFKKALRPLSDAGVNVQVVNQACLRDLVLAQAPGSSALEAYSNPEGGERAIKFGFPLMYGTPLRFTDDDIFMLKDPDLLPEPWYSGDTFGLKKDEIHDAVLCELSEVWSKGQQDRIDIYDARDLGPYKFDGGAFHAEKIWIDQLKFCIREFWCGDFVRTLFAARGVKGLYGLERRFNLFMLIANGQTKNHLTNKKQYLPFFFPKKKPPNVSDMAQYHLVHMQVGRRKLEVVEWLNQHRNEIREVCVGFRQHYTS